MQKLVIDQLFSYGGYYCDQTSWNYWDGCFRNVIWRFYCKNITREAVTFIVDEKRKKAYQETVFTINGEKVLFNLVEYFNAVPFDLIIIAVKGTALEEAIKEIKKYVDKNTIIISVLNGIDSEKVISEYYGREKVIYAVAQGMDAMKDSSYWESLISSKKISWISLLASSIKQKLIMKLKAIFYIVCGLNSC